MQNRENTPDKQGYPGWENGKDLAKLTMIIFLIMSEVHDAAGLQLQLQFVSDQGDKRTIGGLSFGVGNRIPKEALEGI